KRIDQMPIEKLLSAAREAEKDWIDLGDEENAALIKSLADKVDELAVENQDQMRMLESQDRSLLKAYRELEKIGRQLAVLDECTSSDSARIASAVNAIEELPKSSFAMVHCEDCI